MPPFSFISSKTVGVRSEGKLEDVVEYMKGRHYKLIPGAHKVSIYIQSGPKKSVSCDLEEKYLGNYKIFFDGVFLSIYSHLLKKLKLFKLCRKKVMGI